MVLVSAAWRQASVSAWLLKSLLRAAVRRADIACFVRHLEAKGRAAPPYPKPEYQPGMASFPTVGPSWGASCPLSRAPFPRTS